MNECFKHWNDLTKNTNEWITSMNTSSASHKCLPSTFDFPFGLQEFGKNTIVIANEQIESFPLFLREEQSHSLFCYLAHSFENNLSTVQSESMRGRMTEEITNYSADGNYTTIQQQEQQNGISGEQMDWISKLLSECPEAAMNVHKYLQRKYSTQQVFIQHTSSTPKRGHPLDDSGGSVNYGSGGAQRPRKKFQQSIGKTSNKTQQASIIQSQQQQLPSCSTEDHQATNKDVNYRKHLSFDQLKHAVSSNLPCFHMQFTGDVNRNKIPTAIHASDLILKELQMNGVKVNQFTLVGWAGKRLKLGVNNKEDYAALVETDKWPTKINGIDVEVIKPKSFPDSLALVARYVPQELDQEFVSNEIQRTIASADRIKRVQYTYQRKTNDYRFDVKDYQEYKAILKLGRIGIGHSWVAVTPFFSGNRLTYCTKCWCTGHLRNKCEAAPRCRVCLETLTANAQHVCTNGPKCVQCEGNHHSLDNQCHIIREYKQQLKEEVEEAIRNRYHYHYMKDFLQNFIPPLLTSGKLERVTLMPMVQQYLNRFHSAAIRLDDGFQRNRMASYTPTSNQYNILQTKQNPFVLSSMTTDPANNLENASNSNSNPK